MRFANPAALALLLLILLLLFTRRRQAHVRVPIGNLYLWKEAVSRDVTPMARRLRRYWLQLLQAAVLAAIAISIATPMLASDDRPIAVVLDTSLSMGARHDGTSRIELARARVASLLKRVRSDTRVRLIAADSEPHLLGEFRATDPSLGRALGAVRVTDAAADLRAAVQYARAGDRSPRRIYVFSDGDSSQVAGEPDVEWSIIGQTTDNLAITGLSSRRIPARPASTQLLITVSNYGATEAGATLTLSREGVEVARDQVRLLPRASSAVAIMLQEILGQDVITARLEVDDALNSDNGRAIVVPPASRIRVVLLGGSSQFLEKALSTHPDVELAPKNAASPYDLVVCDGCQSLPSGGQGVLFIPQRPPVRPEPIALTSASLDHALAQELDIDGINAVMLASQQLPEGSTVVARGGSVPAIVAYETGSRRIVELRVDPDAGALPLSTAFPVLIANAVEWLAGSERNPLTLVAGDPLRWHVGMQQSQPAVTGPDGRVMRSTFREGVLSFVNTQTAGTYRVRLEDGARVFVVNAAIRGESDLAMGSSQPSPGNTEANEAGLVHRDVTTPFVAVALVLLAFEWRYRLRGVRLG
jgi:hypothetical protein